MFHIKMYQVQFQIKLSNSTFGGQANGRIVKKDGQADRQGKSQRALGT